MPALQGRVAVITSIHTTAIKRSVVERSEVPDMNTADTSRLEGTNTNVLSRL